MEPENSNTQTLIGKISKKDIDSIVSMSQEALDVNLDWMTINCLSNKLGPNDITFFEDQGEASNFCWDHIDGESDFKALNVYAFIRALKGLTHHVDPDDKTIDHLNIHFPSKKLNDHRHGAKGKNYEDLKLKLKHLQLSDEITKYELFAKMQENPKDFQLRYCAVSSNMDRMIYELQFDRKNDDTYALTHYDAILRKATKMPNQKAASLEKQFESIDWDIALYGQKSVEPLMLPVQNIKRDLAELSSSGSENKEAADNLKFRFWSGTILEGEIENIEKLKPIYEVTKRFEGDALDLNAQDAYLLLSLRLLGKQVENTVSQDTQLLTTKNTVMNNDNLEFLQDNMKYLGFGEKLQLNKQLEEQMAKEPKEFQLKTQASFSESDKLEAVLHFRRSDQSGLYFFNKYDAHLKNQNDPSLDRSQTFYINKGSGVTLKEAFNLLSGRAVNKDLTNAEGQKYNAWMKLNFSEKDPYGNYKIAKYTQNYGFNVERQFAKLPVLEANPINPKYNETLRSLKKGNLVQVTASNDEKRYISANPPAGKVELFDANKNQIEAKREAKQGESQSNGQSVANSNKNEKVEGVDVSQTKNHTKTNQKKSPPGDNIEGAAPRQRRSRGR